MVLIPLVRKLVTTGGLLTLLASGGTGVYYMARIRQPPPLVRELHALEQELDDITLYEEFCRDPTISPTSSFTTYADIVRYRHAHVRSNPIVKTYEEDTRYANGSLALFTAMTCILLARSMQKKDDEERHTA